MSHRREGRTVKRRKLRKPGISTISSFLDLQAEVDRDDDNEESDSTSDTIREFLDDESESDIDANHSHTLFPGSAHPNLHLSLEKEHELLVREAERNWRRCQQPSSATSNDVELACESPGERHINLWRITVRRGSEQHYIQLFRREIKNVHPPHPSTFGSAIFQPSIPGVVYIEASSPAEIRRVFDRVHTNCLSQAITLVPPSERVQILGMQSSDIKTVAKGDWVRLRRGTYKGDVGYVAEVDILNSELTLLLVPRLTYLKRFKNSPSIRPPPALFDADRARKSFGVDAVQEGDGFVTFKAMKFVGGLLERVFRLRDLLSADVHPTFDEIKLFSHSRGWDKTATERWGIRDAIAALCAGDRIEVIEGQLRGSNGVIVDKHDGVVAVQICRESDVSWNEDQVLDFPAHQLRKLFKIGDYVRVRRGVHAGTMGYVVNVSAQNMLQIVQEEDLNESKAYNHCSVSGHHIEVYALSVDFAIDQRTYIKPPQAEHLIQHAIVKSARDSFAGKRVVVVGANHYCGYHGTIQHTDEHVDMYGVRLDATGKVEQFTGRHLLDMSTRTLLSHVQPESPAPSPLHQLAPSESTPVWDSSEFQASGGSPAWDPSSRTPCPNLPVSSTVPSEPSSNYRERGVVSSQSPAQDEVPMSSQSVVRKSWLVPGSLNGKSIKVRFSKQIHEYIRGMGTGVIPGGMAYTLGQPESGDPPVIEVRPMIPATVPIAVPVHFLEPVHPCGPNENVVIIAGENLGTDVIVVETGQPLWRLALLDRPKCPVYTAPREHLAVRRKLKL